MLQNNKTQKISKAGSWKHVISQSYWQISSDRMCLSLSVFSSVKSVKQAIHLKRGEEYCISPWFLHSYVIFSMDSVKYYVKALLTVRPFGSLHCVRAVAMINTCPSCNYCIYGWPPFLPSHFILSRMEVEIGALRRRPFKTTGTQW